MSNQDKVVPFFNEQSIDILVKRPDSKPRRGRRSARASPKISAQELEVIHSCANFGEGFEAFYKAHYKRVRSLCLRICKHPQDADDLAQEVFMKVAKNIHTFNGTAQITSWLHTIAEREVLMSFRKKSNRAEKVTSDGDINALCTDTFIPDDARAIDLQRAIAKLPKGFREALEYHDILGYDHQECGQKMGVTAGTVKSQLHKARKKMRKVLPEYGQPNIITVPIPSFEEFLAEPEEEIVPVLAI